MTTPTALATTLCKVCGSPLYSETDGYEIVLRLRATRLEQAVVPLCVKCGYRIFERVITG